MTKSQIEVFVRVKPTYAPSRYVRVDNSNNCIFFHFPPDVQNPLINTSKSDYNFRFNQVFNVDTTQDVVFSSVAEKVVDSALDGYNATIFAYGQSGSGKTYTMTGGSNMAFETFGIIPRALKRIFNEFQNRTEYTFSAHVSYMEIYNETCYDLLETHTQARTLEELPRVLLREDVDGDLQYIGLNKHPVTDEEQAMHLLLLGDTNRMIAETPMNPSSSRSHCVFTVYIDAKKDGSDTIRRSKLHLVDLAGSERVSKTHSQGQTLNEAKHINTSLHFLEMVIMALRDKNRKHIPYRNSKITSILRDSLGGNCKTAMVATMSVEDDNLMESISTMKFAKRVSSISNEAIINEELQPQLVIAKLKQEVAQLKELTSSQGSDPSRELSEEEREKCRVLVQEFLEDSSQDMISVADLALIQECFRRLRGVAYSRSERQTSSREGNDKKEIQELQLALKEKERQLHILVAIVNKKKEHFVDNQTQTDSGAPNSKPNAPTKRDLEQIVREAEIGTQPKTSLVRALSTPPKTDARPIGSPPHPPERSVALRTFLQSYPEAQAVEENVKLLKSKSVEAQNLVKQVNQIKDKITHLKTTIEHVRVVRAMKGQLNRENEEPDPEEEQAKQELEEQKKLYKQYYDKLRDIRKDMDNIELVVKRAQKQLDSDFEQWYSALYGTAAKPIEKSPSISQEIPRGMVLITQKSSEVKVHDIPSAMVPKAAWGLQQSSSTDSLGKSKSVSFATDKEPALRTSVSGSATFKSTGDAAMDEEIRSFYKYRDSLLNKSSH